MSQVQRCVQKKLQRAKFRVLTSLYRGKTRNKPKHKTFKVQFRTLNKMFRAIQLLQWF